jgi:hypothetical protein
MKQQEERMEKKEFTIRLTNQQKEQMKRTTGEAPDMVRIEFDGKELKARPVQRLEKFKN